MDEVNACIAANAETEELVDKPAIVKGTVRVAGPFTMEGVIALEEGPDTPIGGAPEELDNFGAEDGAAAVANAEAHLDKMIRLLKASGVQFPANKKQRFERLDPVTGAALIHAEGEWRNGAGDARRVAVSIGPEAGNVTAWQVEEVVRDANRAGYDDVVFAGFGFDAAAQAAIEHSAHRNLRLHMALNQPGRGPRRPAQDAARQPDIHRVLRAARGRPHPPGGGRLRGRGGGDGRLRSGVQHARAHRRGGHRRLVPGHRLRRAHLLHLPGVLPRQEQVEPAGAGARAHRAGGGGGVRRPERPAQPAVRPARPPPGRAVAHRRQGDRPARQRGPARPHRGGAGMIDRIVIKNFTIPRGASTTCSRSDTLRQEDDMAITVEDFHDLVQLLEDRPQWRAEMRRLVMGDEYLAVPEQIADLQRQTADLQRQTADLQRQTAELRRQTAELQRQTAELRRETAELGHKLEQLRLDMERRFGHVQVQLDQLTTDVGQLKTDVGQLKGENLERRYRERAHAYFGRLISKGRVVGSEQLSDLLEEAVHGGVLTQRDRDEVGWADLVMRGRWIADGRQVMVLAEISSLVDLN